MSELTNEGLALVAEFIADGDLQPATLTRTSKDSFDHIAGTTTESVTTLNCHAMLNPVKSRASNGRMVFETVATLTVAPKVDDKLTLQGRAYTVRSILDTAPHGISIIFEAVVD